MPNTTSRPTMSQSVNSADFTQKLGEYATKLEQKIEALQASQDSAIKAASIKLISDLKGEFGVDDNHPLDIEDIDAKINELKGS